MMSPTEGSRKIAQAIDYFQRNFPDHARTWVAPLRRQLLQMRLERRIRFGGSRCQPIFLIIGAQKAGTTSLFRYLSRHPMVIPPITKEIRYFDWNWRRPLEWYWAHFPLVAQTQKNALVSGEASPFYLGHPKCAERVAKVLPQVKLIALLRDPIGRAISHYQHALRSGWESRTMDEALLAKESFYLPDDNAHEDLQLVSVSRNYVARGYYADQLQRWFNKFDKEQLLILQSEQLFSEPALVYAEVLDFLKLPSFQLNDTKPYNAGRYQNYLNPDLMQTLASHYAEPNQRLYKLLSHDFRWEQGWKTPRSKS